MTPPPSPNPHGLPLFLFGRAQGCRLMKRGLIPPRSATVISQTPLLTCGPLRDPNRPPTPTPLHLTGPPSPLSPPQPPTPRRPSFLWVAPNRPACPVAAEDTQLQPAWQRETERALRGRGGAIGKRPLDPRRVRDFREALSEGVEGKNGLQNEDLTCHKSTIKLMEIFVFST